MKASEIRKLSAEVCENISGSKRGELNPMYGKTSPRKGVKLSEETKQKLREAAIRRNNHGTNRT